MKKYNKIMEVFTATLDKLDSLIEKNDTAVIKLGLKAQTIVDKVDELEGESSAATKAALKIREFLA